MQLSIMHQIALRATMTILTKSPASQRTRNWCEINLNFLRVDYRLLSWSDKSSHWYTYNEKLFKLWIAVFGSRFFFSNPKQTEETKAKQSQLSSRLAKVSENIAAQPANEILYNNKLLRSHMTNLKDVSYNFKSRSQAFSKINKNSP